VCVEEGGGFVVWRGILGCDGRVVCEFLHVVGGYNWTEVVGWNE
jgi:hypothetical protein